MQESTRVDGLETEDAEPSCDTVKVCLEQALRDIAQSVIADADLAMALSDSPRATVVDELTESMADLGLGRSPRYFFFIILNVLFCYKKLKIYFLKVNHEEFVIASA